MAARYVPQKFKCATAVEIEEALGKSILARVSQLGLTPYEVVKTYPSVRLGDIIRRLEMGRRSVAACHAQSSRPLAATSR
ncbi:hypothetical protein [Rhizobium sp. P007]|uniref:hypothetical protein n=1 Tax=Rhizobium sp. P007 TaxID=285908 RepID=UPI00115A6F8E|nr:hypothetical protein [Rhizobium sp. P007]CAD7058573.1 hypothetical protein RP007_02577 [Rhizobium sp. P007]